jgi:hypothetical protein
MANITISKAIGKGKGLVATPSPRKMGGTIPSGKVAKPTTHTAGTKRAPGY